ncbi:hypothetical protein BJ875DRAFT_449854 [Amylocarpus encephaloides]|uniref:ARID domain-containing protein n=1 Tax=Amylocarpus encephaloides TaxID=45428 RepID=A0A9P7YSB5_9HELO|nr:hypothetical protein BJ875DRAFT_449854 [Amylocarpus encephaloides]
MAPSPSSGDPALYAIEYTPEYNQFIEKLAAYHEQRGTEFIREPKVGARQIDLLKLYQRVMSYGGYDKVSDEKKAWRGLGDEFALGNAHQPALAFSLKSVYYKNLAAYEISTVHGKEPPPKEILEHQTAKGGGLLTRTLENFKSRKQTADDQSEASGEDGTPSRDRNGSEEAPGSGGRITRGLRQAPPQRVLFQSDTQSSRPTRHVPSTPQHQSHGTSTSYNPSSNIDNMSLAVANYEPRPQMPMTLRPIITPGNNPVEFSRRQIAKIASLDAATGKPSSLTNRGVMLPGSGFDGPNIYVRCLCSLKSAIPSEQDYALHHLVKISMERGDKYRFESFSGLAEALIEKLLEASSLFYKVDWRISYNYDKTMMGIDTLDGIEGTPDILQRIEQLEKREIDDNIQTAAFSDALLQINEAALTMRNMVMLEENAQYVSEMAPLRDFLSIALNLPRLHCLVELKHYALDIAEQLTKYLHLDDADPLYISLLAQLESEDRGAVLTSLRAISRISMTLEENNLLHGVPRAALQRIIYWTLLYDEEMVHACLDFLYQYTAVVSNVDFLVSTVHVEPLVNQLTRLLAYGARDVYSSLLLTNEVRRSSPQELAKLPRELLVQLLRLDEPERSSQWLRCLFEEDKDESITQIKLWTAYQDRFLPVIGETNRSILPAADFIKNVSTTFAEKANAQVQTGLVPKFVIKGIRMRHVPVDFQGKEYSECLWGIFPGNSHSKCGEFFMSPQEMFFHIMELHLHTPMSPGVIFTNRGGQFTCAWGSCTRFHHHPATRLSDLASHIKLHLPPSHIPKAQAEGPSAAKKAKLSYVTPPVKVNFRWQQTAVDENQAAAGIPLSAVLVLRNLARNLSKTDADETALKLSGVSWVDQLFKPVEPKLYEVLAHNKPLATYVTDLLSAINDP